MLFKPKLLIRTGAIEVNDGIVNIGVNGDGAAKNVANGGIGNIGAIEATLFTGTIGGGIG